MCIRDRSLISRPSTETQHRDALVLQPPAVVLSPNATIRRNSPACQSRFVPGLDLEPASASPDEVAAANDPASSSRRES